MRLHAMHSLFTSARRRRAFAGVALVAAATMLPGCTSRQMEGVSSSYLVMEALNASPGDDDEFSTFLESDVASGPSTSPTVIADIGRADLRLALKDPGTTTSPAVPTSANWITVTRYHVKFVRSDGRNTQGVDVPYEFDGAASVTVRESTTSMQLFFTLVRVQAKIEQPLMALRQQGGQVVVSTLAEVTLYGFDQAGREVSVVGKIGVNFADYGG